MRHLSMTEGAASPVALLAACSAMAQSQTAQGEEAQDQEARGEGAQVLSAWGYDPLHAEGWSVETMVTMTDVTDATGETTEQYDDERLQSREGRQAHSQDSECPTSARKTASRVRNP